MENNRTARSDRKSGINKEQYRLNKNRKNELIYFCRQYKNWIDLRKKLTAVKSTSIVKPVPTNRYSDPTSNIAMILSDVSKPIKLVEDAANSIDEKYRYYILLAVTEGYSYNTLLYRYNLQFGKDEFEYYLAKFYWSLSIKKGF